MATTIQTIETPKRARALDTSGNNNHGQIYSGRALEFDGVTDSLTVTTDVENIMPHMAVAGTFTVACWINMNSLKDTPVWYATNDIAGGGGYSNNRMGLNLGNEGEVAFTKYTGSYTHKSNTATGEPALSINTWYRAVCVMSSGTQKLYINGVEVTGTGAGDANNLASVESDRFIIGERDDVYFDGMISDFQSWDAAWSADDVTYDYLNPESTVLNRGGTSLTESNLKLWYPMQDGHRGNQSYILDASNTGLGDDLVVNGDFATSGTPTTSSYSLGWRQGHADDDGTNITGGELIFTHTASSNSNYTRAYITDGSALITLVVGTTYKFTYTVSNIVSGSPTLQYYDGDTYNGIEETIGTHTVYFTPTSANYFIIKSEHGAASEIRLSYVSLEPVNDKNNATTVFYGDEEAVNGDFETFPTLSASDNDTFTDESEDGSQNVTMVTETGVANNGSKSAKATLTATEGYITYNKTDYVVGRTYRASVAMRKGAGKTITGFQMFADDSIRGEDGTDGTALSSITEGFQTASVTFIATATTMFINMKFIGASGHWAFIDDFSIKEVGVASGWTDADQQLHIPQTALQSYNEFAWSLDTYDAGGGVLFADAESEIAGGGDLFDIEQSDFTANFWLFLSKDASENGSYVFHKGGGGSEGWHFKILASNGSCQFLLEDDGANIEIAQTGGGDDRIPLGKWVMITGVVDYGTDTKIYVNGELKDTEGWGTLNSNSIEGSGNLEFLNWATDYANGILEGTATEFSIFKNTAGTAGGALSQAEINELYNDGKPLDATTHSQAASLKGYWRNDGISTIWHNKVLTSNVVTINEGAEYSDSDTTLTVNNGGLVKVNDVLVIDNEELLVTAKSTHDLTVVRGYRGTTAVAHADGTNISIYKNATLQNANHGKILIPEGLDNRDSQGFIMNRQRNTSSLNLLKRPYDVSSQRGGMYTEINDSDTLDFGVGAFTMEVWAKYKYTNTGSIYNVIFSLGNNIASTDIGTGIASKDGEFVGRIYNTEIGSTSTDHSATLVEGNWYHLAVTLGTDNTATFYFNGVAGGTNTITGDITNAHTKRVGMDSNTARNYGEAIDSMRIYSKELSATEILRNYNATKGSHTN